MTAIADPARLECTELREVWMASSAIARAAHPARRLRNYWRSSVHSSRGSERRGESPDVAVSAECVTRRNSQAPKTSLACR